MDQGRWSEKAIASSSVLNRRGFRRMAPAALFVLVAALISSAVFLFAYNHEQDDVNGPTLTRWCSNGATPCTLSVIWSLGPQGTNVNTTGGGSIVEAISSSFQSWQGANLNGGQMTGFSSVAQGADSTTAAPNAADCVNVIGFTDPNSGDFPTGTIAFTAVTTVFGGPPAGSYTCTTGQTSRTCPLASCIVDVDIEFNPNKTFATASPTPSGDFDLQSIATHEIGHLLGLDHSGLASSIMFAYGDRGVVPQRNLSTDDAIGIGSIYPSANFNSDTGKLTGHANLNGSGVFASHVVVIDSNTGAPVVDTLTNTDGSYSVFVPPGSYNVVALPLAGLYNITAFGSWACGYGDNVPPCCNPATTKSCSATGALTPPTNYTGTFN
ncbi:MAG: matrixin family metalloprotease [Acidobacteriota bacterium]|nr:matrixin family metalloprotease [Acidobacteriota bacterium]